MQQTSETISVTLDHKKETQRYVVALDGDGKERWFDKHHVNCRIEGGKVTVELPASAWQRRIAKDLEKNKAPTQMQAVTTWVRNCLKCGKKKELEKRMFVCCDCKRTAEWQNG